MGTPPDLLLLDAATATGTGFVIAPAQGVRYGGDVDAPNQNQYPVAFKVFATLWNTVSGATATVAVQDSPDNSTFTTLGSFVLTLGLGATQEGQALLFESDQPYLRANLTAISGASAKVSSYLTFGTYGA